MNWTVILLLQATVSLNYIENFKITIVVSLLKIFHFYKKIISTFVSNSKKILIFALTIWAEWSELPGKERKLSSPVF